MSQIPSAANGRRCMSPEGSRGYPLVVTTGALPTGYLPTGVLPTGNLPTGPVCTTGCARGRSAAMAVPIKAKDAVPMITNFNVVSPAAQLAPSRFTISPNDRYEAISRAQTSDRTVAFLTDVAEMARVLEDWVPASSSRYRSSSRCTLNLLNQRENPAGPRHVGAITVAEGFQHHSLFPGNAAEKQGPKTDQARATGNPVRQQQCLSDSPQPEC